MEYLFISCPCFEEKRREMVSYTKGQINTKEFVLESENIKPILDFLKKTGIGFAKELRTKLRGKEIEREEEEEELDKAIEAARGNKIGEDDDEGMGGFAFGAFEW
jgi:DNA primase catalytic subunit